MYIIRKPPWEEADLAGDRGSPGRVLQQRAERLPWRVIQTTLDR